MQVLCTVPAEALGGGERLLDERRVAVEVTRRRHERRHMRIRPSVLGLLALELKVLKV